MTLLQQETIMQKLFIMLTFMSSPLMAQQNIRVESKGAVLNTFVYPHANAETIVLLHGGPGVPDPMHSVIDLLRDRFQVVYFQQRGTGASDCPGGTYGIGDYIADLDAVADTLRLEKFHLFGHSWGGLYAQIYAQEHPEKLLSMVLCSPSSGTGEVWKQTEKEVMAFNKAAGSTWQWLLMGWHSIWGALGSDRAYRRLFRRVLKNYNAGFKVAEESYDWLDGIAADPVNNTRRSILAYPPLERMNEFSFPVTIIYGDKDIYGESRKQVIERYPAAQVVVIENSGHLPWAHQPEQFSAAIKAHFSRSL